MNVSKIWRRLMWLSTPREIACSELFEQHRLRKRELLSLAKTPTQMENMRQDLLSLPPVKYNEMISLLPSAPSLKNTSLISDIPILVTVHFYDGRSKACFFGMSSLVAKQVNHYLTTGMNIPISPKKSRRSFRKKGSSSASSELLPKDIWKK